MDDTTVLRQRPRKHSRSMSMSMAATRASCTPLSSLLDSSEGLYRYDGPSPVATLVSLRVQVLSYLDDLENRLSQLIPTVDSDEDSDEVDAGGLNGIPGAEELTLSDEVRQWARDGLAMLQHIREDVSSRLPSLIDDATARYDGVKARLPTSLSEMSLPDMTSVSYSVPHLPDWDWKDLPDLRTRLEDVKTAVSDFDLAAYLPTLSARLTRLHAHLSSSSPSSLDFSAIPSPSLILSEFIDRVRTTIEGQDEEEDSALEKAVKDLARAAKASMDGAKLIAFDDLPHAWRNNHFVKSRYRFIPLEKWPLIIFSLFMLHNETVNIHTHLIPFFTWMTHLFPSVSEVAGQYELPERVFLAFACLCLLSSAIWHTMSGCAHQEGMELCARVDYVGIGWLIAASVGTVVHYGFGGHPFASNLYLTLCLLMGVTGSVFPFMAWFNLREYKNYRVAFFLFLAFTALAPLAHLSALYSVRQMLAFIGPIVPSLYCYLIGLFFYVTHFPECFLSRYPRVGYWMDHIGGGSHAIWHLLIVRAIWLHKTGMVELKAGVV